MRFFPPPLDDAARHYHDCTLPFNLAGVPALALPVPAGSRLPASVQLVGPSGSEEVLLATGAIKVDPIISAKAPLDEGPAWFDRLYDHNSRLMKVVLQP